MPDARGYGFEGVDLVVFFGVCVHVWIGHRPTQTHTDGQNVNSFHKVKLVWTSCGLVFLVLVILFDLRNIY
jgi:hypothetical protein